MSTGELPPRKKTALADNESNATKVESVGARVMVYDGATWDRARGVSLGQTTEASSVPVTLASDQPSVEVEGDAAEDAAAAGNPLLCGGRYDATARTLDAGDAGAVALDESGRLATQDPILNISRGLFSNMTHVNKFGRSTAITTTNTWEVWDGNAAYTWPTSATITHIRAAVDSATTQGQTIEVQGLDASWDLQVQTKALDGTDSTTEVALDTALIRVFRMKVLDASLADQDIWAGPTGFATKQAIITAGNNQTLMAIYTVPNGKTAYVTNYYATANPGGGAPTTFNIALWGADQANSYARQLKHVQGVSADADAYGRMQHFFKPYYKFTQKTDIIVTGAPTGASVDVSAGFDLILVDN